MKTGHGRRGNSLPGGERLEAEQQETLGGQGRETSTPLDAATSGRLEVLGGVSRLFIHAAPSLLDLYRARFTGPLRDIRVRNGTVTIQFLHPYARHRSDHTADIALNASIPWQIGVRAGVSDLDADLSGLRLGSLDVGEGANRIELTLPQPDGMSAVGIDGGANTVIVHRPVGVAVRLRVRGGIAAVLLDGRRYTSQGGDTLLETPDDGGAATHYDIAFRGGANSLTVDTR